MADSKKFNKSNQHHDNLSYSGHKNYNSSSPPKPNKSIATAIVDAMFGPGPKVNSHGNGTKNCKKKY